MTAIVYAPAKHKGGVGMTTLAMSLAAGLARHGASAVVGASPQGSTVLWTRSATPSRFAVVAAADGLEARFERSCADCVFVAVDCSPATEAVQRHAALAGVQVLLVPELSSPKGLWATARIENMVKRTRGRCPRLKVRLIAKQTEACNATSRALGSALGEIARSLCCVRPYQTQRLPHRRARRCERVRARRTRRLATAEVDALIEEVLGL